MLVVLIIIVIIIFLYTYKKPNIVEGLYTFNGKMAINSMYFYDKLFQNVIYYPNIYNQKFDTGEAVGKLLKTGWQRCREDSLQGRVGHCVEYGPTGASYGFSAEGINAITGIKN